MKNKELMPFVKLYNFFSKSDFSKSLITLLTGTALAQIITLIASVFISRIYKPEDFGVYALFISVSSVIALIISGRYEIAINLPKKDRKSINILGLCFSLNFFFSIIFLFICILIFFLSNKNRISYVFLLFPFMVFLLNNTYILQNWLIRKKKFKAITFSKILNSVITNLFTIVIGIFLIGEIGLFFGNLVGLITFNLLLLFYVFYYHKKILKLINKKEMIESARKYIDLPKVNIFQSIIDSFQTQGLIYLIAFLFNSSIVGLYSLTLRILQAPISLIISSLTQVFYQKVSEYYNSNIDFRPLIKKILLKLLIGIIPLSLIFIIFGPFIFSKIFGDQWYESGVYARILAPSIFIDFLRIPISQIPIIVNKQKEQLYYSLINNSLIILSMFVSGYYFNNIKIGLIFASLIQIIYVCWIVFWIMKISKIKNE